MNETFIHARCRTIRNSSGLPDEIIDHDVIWSSLEKEKQILCLIMKLCAGQQTDKDVRASRGTRFTGNVTFQLVHEHTTQNIEIKGIDWIPAI